ncbi:hypothetical protein M8542_43105 [Amycolatopsis sp. OK19-0408]|uniref:Uncharacterized protein n=1 Tax=Amycolatopsis iheyensis TaxID=2945988 RepID=A0A9X2SR73_9PSEU|nr:hypothetical protein [Amycolatopsis iheyensis]MCR6489625.1 hypothetical protein [Amycolatopsis iheyensis]
MPIQELVSWIDGACGARTTLEKLKKSSSTAYERVRTSSDRTGMEAWNYVGSRLVDLQALENQLSGLPPVATPATDSWRTTLRDALTSPKAQLTAFHQLTTSGSTPLTELQIRASQAADLVAKLPVPEFDPVLNTAYAQAPRCTPPKTSAPTTAPPAVPPPAADGQNYASCGDGRCEVKVAKSARIPVFELRFATTFTGGTVSLSTAFPGGGRSTISIGESGTATIGRPDGSQIVITFKGVNAGAAVLDVTTK